MLFTLSTEGNDTVSGNQYSIPCQGMQQLGKENKGKIASEKRQQYLSNCSLSLSQAYAKTASLLARRRGSVQDTALSL